MCWLGTKPPESSGSASVPCFGAAPHEPVVVEDLAAEIEDISDEEEEARRRAKQDYYNAQIALGNMRVQLPPPGEGV